MAPQHESVELGNSECGITTAWCIKCQQQAQDRWTGSHQKACPRLVTLLAAEQSDDWITGKRYLNMEDLEEQEETANQNARKLQMVE